jgi:hypothetical protein
MEAEVVRTSLHDGARDRITVLACICADGTPLPPGLIYQSKASTIWSSWVEDIHQDQPAFVTATPSGWTNEDTGLQWLIQVFDRETKARARQSWRLLYIDGHGSHVTLEFLEYRGANRILVACFPPHATHTVQPLDVVVFKSLSSAYSREHPEHQLFQVSERSISIDFSSKHDSNAFVNLFPNLLPSLQALWPARCPILSFSSSLS